MMINTIMENQCLLKLLGFTARDLSDMGKAPAPTAGDSGALKIYRDQLDKRSYQLNAASVRFDPGNQKRVAP